MAVGSKPQVTLTNSRIRRLPIGRHKDAATPGLYVVIGKRAISYTFLYKRNGNSQFVQIGKASDGMTIEEARREAGRLHDRLREGGNPKDEIKTASGRKSSTITFREAWDEYCEVHLANRRNPKKEASIVERLAIPALANKAIISISKNDARDVIKAAMKSAAKNENARRKRGGKPPSPTAGHHSGKNLQARLRHFFNWCRDCDYTEFNPFERLGIEFLTEARERFLSLPEIERVLHVSNSHPNPTYRALVQTLFYTGMRDTSEVTAMRFGWLDLTPDAEAVVIPADNAKNRKINTAALPARTAHLLRYLRAKALQYLDEESRDLTEIDDLFVFSTNGTAQYQGLSKDKARLDQLLTEHATETDQPNIDHFTHHDLRRTAATQLAALGCSEEIIERGVLRHLPAGKSDLKRTYGRHEYVNEAREALNTLVEAYHANDHQNALVDLDIIEREKQWATLSPEQKERARQFDPFSNGYESRSESGLDAETLAILEDETMAGYDYGQRGRKKRLGIKPPSRRTLAEKAAIEQSSEG